jgi:hypothetical protein
MAYSDDGSIDDLTRRVGADGVLDWTAPAGNWTLYALFQGWHGKLVERAQTQVRGTTPVLAAASSVSYRQENEWLPWVVGIGGLAVLAWVVVRSKRESADETRWQGEMAKTS